MKNVAITTKRLWRKRNEAKSGPRGGAQNCARRKETTTTQTKRLQVPKMQNAPWVSWCSFDDSSSRIQNEKKKEREREKFKYKMATCILVYNV